MAEQETSEYCRKCGHDNPSWSAQSPLWNAVMRGGSIDGEALYGDMVCASCFMQIAEDAGIAEGWRLVASTINVPLEMTTPSGRVWDEEHFLWRDGPMAEQEMLTVDREGPAPLPRPETLHCSGCRHLVTKWWKDYLDNDETDSGTSARCAAVPTEHGGESISAYWTSTKQTPDWCPFINAARHRLAATKTADERVRVLTEALREIAKGRGLADQTQIACAALAEAGGRGG